MKKVLIVEPQAANARSLKKLLREAGLLNSSIALKTGRDAKSHLAGRDQDAIVILNTHAADGDGMEFLDWLRAQPFHQDLLVIALGERSQLRGVVEACERGAHTFLINPVHVEDLKSLAEKYPDHWGLTPE
jgi:DNA-binding NtrC family response regulator